MAHLTSSTLFPPAESADSQGLIGIGGELSPPWLLDAYRHGIFPWPLVDGTLAWWSPDPRAVIEFERFHVPRRLQRSLRQQPFEVTFDRDFAGVLHGCATAQQRRYATWITPAMRVAYRRLHELGIAHSVEARRDGRLVGGIYGLALGRMFSAESMFYVETDASKCALVALVRRLSEAGCTLLDIQQLTPHTERFGGSEIPRRDFLARLTESLSSPGNEACWH